MAFFRCFSGPLGSVNGSKLQWLENMFFFASGTHDFQDLVIVSSEHPSIPLENEGRTELENNHE